MNDNRMFRCGLAALLLSLLASCGGKAPATPSAPAAAELTSEDVAVVQRGDIDDAIAITGSLHALQQTTLTAQIDGVIAKVDVRPGDSVRAGQTLAEYDTRDLDKQMLVAQAQLSKSRDMLAYNRKQAARNADLLKQNFISRNAFDASDSQLQTAAADVNVSEAQLALAKQALAKGKVVAPFAGTIAERLVEPGQRVGVNNKLLTLVDLSELEWVAAVPSGKIGQVHVGQTAELTVDGFEQTFTGQVTRINPSVDASNKSVAVYIRVPNQQHLLRDGLFAQGRLQVDVRKHTLIVPTDAVRSENGKQYVLAIENGHLQRHDVILGANDAVGGRVEIRTGIGAGATVLVSGVRLTSGMMVKLVRHTN